MFGYASELRSLTQVSCRKSNCYVALAVSDFRLVCGYKSFSFFINDGFSEYKLFMSDLLMRYMLYPHPYTYNFL